MGKMSPFRVVSPLLHVDLGPKWPSKLPQALPRPLLGRNGFKMVSKSLTDLDIEATSRVPERAERERNTYGCRKNWRIFATLANSFVEISIYIHLNMTCIVNTNK